MFRVNKLTDYGIVLMAHIARSPADMPHTARNVSEETGLPLPTVRKLMRELSDHRLLISHSGVKGGYSLARNANAISVAEIIGALEGPIGFTECSTDPGTCEMEPSCAIRSNSKVIGGALRTALEKIMLPDLYYHIPHRRRDHNTLISSISWETQGAR